MAPPPNIATAKRRREKPSGDSGGSLERSEENMRRWFGPLWVGTAMSALVSGCTMKNADVAPAQLMSEMQAGQPMLDCRVDCGLAWANNRQQAAILASTGQWQQLALLVMRIGYMDDLTYY